RDSRPHWRPALASQHVPDASTLFSLLKQVSRSFYLTLRLLPAPIRSQIGLAYLLARATDTVADTRAIPLESRLATLSALRARILGQTAEPLSLNLFVERGGNDSSTVPSPAERLLLQRLEEFLAC